VRELDVPSGWVKDPDHIAWLTQETVQVSAFCVMSAPYYKHAWEELA